MTTASEDAFYDAENKERRMTHKEIVFDAIDALRGLTIREVSVWTKLTYNQVQKRTDDLINEGRIKVLGEKVEDGNRNSVFIVVREPKMCFKKESLRKWLERNHREIFDEYIEYSK